MDRSPTSKLLALKKTCTRDFLRSKLGKRLQQRRKVSSVLKVPEQLRNKPYSFTLAKKLTQLHYIFSDIWLLWKKLTHFFIFVNFCFLMKMLSDSFKLLKILSLRLLLWTILDSQERFSTQKWRILCQ